MLGVLVTMCVPWSARAADDNGLTPCGGGPDQAIATEGEPDAEATPELHAGNVVVRFGFDVGFNHKEGAAGTMGDPVFPTSNAKVGYGMMAEYLATDHVGVGGFLELAYDHTTRFGSTAQLLVGPRFSYRFLPGRVRPFVALQLGGGTLFIPANGVAGVFQVNPEVGFSVRVDDGGTEAQFGLGYGFRVIALSDGVRWFHSIPCSVTFGKTF